MSSISQPKKISTLLGIIFLDQIYITMVFPLLTLLFFDEQSRLFAPGTSYAVRSIWYGFCAALPRILNIFFTPLLSGLSDHWGRKKILLIAVTGASCFFLTAILGIIFGVLGILLVGLVILGIFARTNAAAQAIMGDMSPREKKVLYMGYLQFAISVGACIGPIIGGYFAQRFFFAEINFSLPFCIAALLALCNVACIFMFLPETLPPSPDPSRQRFHLRAMLAVFLHPEVLRVSFLLLLVQLSWSMYYQYIPPILKTLYGFDATHLGWFIGLIAFWLAVATGLGVKLLDSYFTIRQVLIISLYLVLGGLLLTVFSCAYMTSLPSLLVWLGAIPIAMGDVIAYSCLTALYSDVVSQEQQGKVMGVCFIVVSLMWATTGFLGGLLLSFSPWLPLLIAPLGVVLALVLMHANFGKQLAVRYDGS